MPQFENDWKPILRSDTALNDSDKSFTVPAGKIWRVKWVWVELISTAIKAGAVQAASITRNYMFSPYAVNLTSFVDTSFLSTPIPELILPQNFIIRAFDSTAVDAAADDMVVHLMVEQYG
jgi:hypothetical protein